MLDALAPALERRVPVAFDASEEREILRALAFAKEFNLDPIIVGGAEAANVIEDLKAAKARVIVSTNFQAVGGVRGDAAARVGEEEERSIRRANHPHAPERREGSCRCPGEGRHSARLHDRWPAEPRGLRAQCRANRAGGRPGRGRGRQGADRQRREARRRGRSARHHREREDGESDRHRRQPVRQWTDPSRVRRRLAGRSRVPDAGAGGRGGRGSQ